MHALARHYIEEAVAKNGPFTGAVVEFGSRNVNGGVRDLFPDAESFLGIDPMPGPGVDRILDASIWVPDKKYCCVITSETFEHAKNWRRILDVTASALEPNGVLIVTCATDPRKPHSGIEVGGIVRDKEYYANVPPDDFAKEAKKLGFRIDMIVDTVHGDLYATCIYEPRK